MSRVETIGDAQLWLGDCREILPTLGQVDAVVTDPPYGIGEAAGANKSRTKAAFAKDYGSASWDDQPIDSDLLRLVMLAGRWNVIFGGNYYPLPATRCWLVWDKLNSGDFADCELAWTNLPKAVRRLRYLWNGMIKAHGETRGDHPTQKPVGVMSWCLQQLPDGTKSIIDPFMGSGTTGVACAKAGMRFIGIEREPQYFEAACRRIEEVQRQPRLFDEPAPKPQQLSLIEGDAA
jgi:DNA modification methylase